MSSIPPRSSVSIREIRARGVTAVAVCLLHGYRNPTHERAVRAVIERVAPDIETSISSEVVPEIKEYERTSTTVCNAYVKSLVDRYLSELEHKLRELGVKGALMVMLSSGGVATVSTSREFPVRLLESGPAAGALAAAHVGTPVRPADLLSFDMGGTTAKVCLIEDGAASSRPRSSRSIGSTGSRREPGLPVKIPVIDMIEIGAGGGSIASVDALGLLRIGPQSAGADPGPACYGARRHRADRHRRRPRARLPRSGVLSRRTDAARSGRARAAIQSHVAEPLGLSLAQAAWGIHHVVDENMANAARIHAIDRGKDLRSVPVFAFGGAGPVHAFDVASILHCPSIILPLAAGVASTMGFLTAPLAFDFVRTLIERLDEIDWGRANVIRSAMEREGVALLERSGVPRQEISISHSADLRYLGQGHEVTVPFPSSALGPDSHQPIVDAFNSTYRRIYGRLADDVPVEVINWRTVVSGPPPFLDLRRTAGRRSHDSDAIKGQRPAYFWRLGGYHLTPVYDRYRLQPGASVHGPAIIEERESTAVLGPASVGTIDEFLNLIVRPSHGA